MNISAHLKGATAILQTAGVSEPRKEASSLMAFVLNKNQTFLIAHSEYNLSIEEEKLFQSIITRRAAREPFQYIVGKQEFYGLDFEVTPDVLIPRPETEIIVENAIEILHEKQNARVCEIGVGSGCICVSILHEVKTATAVGLDIAEKALEIARKNAQRHMVSDQIEFRVSDVFAAVAKNEKFDLIVSNPPYIPAIDIESLQAEVRDFEPLNALTDDQDGLSIIEKLINHSPDFLDQNGFLLMEIGFDQSEKVRKLFSPDKWTEVKFLPDLQGIARTVKARLGSPIN